MRVLQPRRGVTRAWPEGATEAVCAGVTSCRFRHVRLVRTGRRTCWSRCGGRGAQTSDGACRSIWDALRPPCCSVCEIRRRSGRGGTVEPARHVPSAQAPCPIGTAPACSPGAPAGHVRPPCRPSGRAALGCHGESTMDRVWRAEARRESGGELRRREAAAAGSNGSTRPMLPSSSSSPSSPPARSTSALFHLELMVPSPSHRSA